MLNVLQVNGNMKGNGNFELAFGGKATSMIVDKLGEDASRKEAAKMHNQAVDNYKRVLDNKVQKGLQEAEEATKRMDTLEIVPINRYVLVKPFASNPFDKLETTETGLIIPKMSDGRNFKNPDSGEEDTEVNLSVQATVIEVAPDCKFVKEGDIIYYRRVSAVPLPFFRQGFEVVSENSIQVVINEGLKKRFNGE